MFYRLKRHPFPVEAHFDHCLVLAFAFPRHVLAPLLPSAMQLDTFADLGFVAVAIVQTRDLRPAGWPRWLGQDFLLTGYRIFARYRTNSGRTLRGLRILRSDTDRRRMAFGGNLLTHYNYKHCEADLRVSAASLELRLRSDDGRANVDVAADLSPESSLAPVRLPEGSPFTQPTDARRFAGPLPWTFDYEPQTHSVIRIRGVRQHWDPRLIRAEVRDVSFLHDPMFQNAKPILASVFYTGGIDYRWERGIVEPQQDRESAATAQAGAS